MSKILHYILLQGFSHLETLHSTLPQSPDHPDTLCSTLLLSPAHLETAKAAAAWKRDVTDVWRNRRLVSLIHDKSSILQLGSF